MTDRGKLVAKIGAGATALAVPLVMLYEGTVLQSCRDPIGIITACVGHTGPELRMGQRYTRQQCEDMLYGDLLKHAQALDCIKQPMTDGQKARLMSQGLRKLRSKMTSVRSSAIIFWVNQLRANIQSMGYGPQTVTKKGPRHLSDRTSSDKINHKL